MRRIIVLTLIESLIFLSPTIFPVSTSPTLPTFPFNYVAQSGAVLKTRINVTSAPPGTATVFLKEGTVELTVPLGSAGPSGMQVNL